MSDQRANSGSATRRQQAATLLIAVGGGLGILNTAIEYIHNVQENRNILLTALFYIGIYVLSFPLTFGILYVIGAFFTIRLFEWLSKRFPDRFKTIHKAYLILLSLAAAAENVYVTIVSVQPPATYDGFTIFIIVLGGAAILSLCILLYLQLVAPGSGANA